uniref:C-type lectin domain-containing protein n=1 Tax=Steinernema glaseri TaxID=37863 RepID=A0A1I7ZIM3_9BILA
MTVAMNFHETQETPLMSLGTPCFSTRNDRQFRKDFRRLALLANCFCMAPYRQFTDPDTCGRFAECLYLAESPSDYQSAQIGCRAENATLPDVFSAAKEHFLERNAVTEGHFPFWIGLNNMKNNDYLEWDSGDLFSTRVYSDFPQGWRLRNGDVCVAAVQAPHTQMVSWDQQGCDFDGPTNYYYCQKTACDASNYCN